MSWRKLAKLAGADEIARRLLVTNGVDALLSSLGVVVGTATASHVNDPRVYLGASLGSALSLGLLSGFLGVYLTELSERVKELEEMERAVQGDLSHSIYAKAAKVVPLYVAAWSLVGSMVLPLVALSPFLLSFFGLPVETATVMSVIIAYLELAALGAYSSRSLKGALTYVGLGVAATVIATFLGSLLK